METLLFPPPVIWAVVSVVFQIMLTDAGMRMRMSPAAVMVGVAASVIVMALIAVAACPTRNSWSAADAIVGCTIWIVRLSRAAVPPPGPVITSCRESAAETAVKFWYWSPDTMICCWPEPKVPVTSRTSVLPPSS